MLLHNLLGFIEYTRGGEPGGGLRASWGEDDSVRSLCWRSIKFTRAEHTHAHRRLLDPAYTYYI